MSTVSKDAWDAKGQELFGEDMEDWQFVCPTCGLVQSIARAKKEWPQLKDRNWNVTSECVGRYTKDVGCDWAAYGLFRGPLFVELNNGDEIAAFDFVGKPFTGDAS